MTADENSKAVLVVGAGIAGMAAGMHLAHLGHPVYLLDAAPAIGGSMHLLDHTFPTDSCGICLMLPHQPAFCPTFECDRQPNITLLPYAELTALTGGAQSEPALSNAEGPAEGSGAFAATVRHNARYVDVDACNGCADCAAVCPEPRPHDHEGWLAPVKAIFRPPGLRAVPDAWVIDMDTCTRCGACVEACPTGAIDLDMQPRQETLQVGAVLLTPGFAPFDARLKGEYGYRVYDNVLSALEFERMASLAGSSIAHLARPSDGMPPQRVAFVHCVGSRDNLCGAGHCSSTCCMFTAKQVALGKKLDPELDVTVFHMDLRAFGKDFEAYIEGVQALPGVTYRRAMPSSVHQLQQTKDLLLTYAGEDGQLREEAFDLLVLAVGFAPPPGMQDLARELGIPLNDYGFALTGGYHPTRTGRPGLFVAGAFREPKDIPETVAEAAGAAAEVAAFLQGSGELGTWDSRGSGATPHTARDVADEEARIGVFVCECNGNPSSPSGQGLSAIGVPGIVRWAEALPGVALSQAVPDGCSPQGRAAIQAAIEAEGLNRVVVAGCSPRLFAGEFEALMRGVGLDPRLLARVNLREQVLYPHRNNGAGLTGKAQSLVGMAVAGLKTMAGVEALALGASQTLTRRAVVVGGGAAGLTAALQLARLDIPVDLVEREAELGGQWRHIRYQAEALAGPSTQLRAGTGGSDPQAALAELIAGVEAEERIQVHLAAELTAMEGGPGRYASVIVQDGREETVDHGVLVVATGGRPAATTEYLYGQHARVVTQRELEQQLANPNPQDPISDLQTVVMIQCVGSREPERPYCSRVCCTQAVKNALKLKELRPEANVYVLYREVRTYGFREAAYQAARDAGVVFLRYELPDKPQVQAAGDQLRVALTEPVTGQPVELDADLLVLSAGIDPEEEQTLAETLGVDLNGDGFFQEEHPKMKPLDLRKKKGTKEGKKKGAKEGKKKGAKGGSGGGFYVAGLAHSPRFLEETIAQAQGAAMRAAAFLAPLEVTDRPTSVWVNARLCSFCELCVETCPFEARVMNYDTRVADVDYTLCQGCGVCAMVCPNKATLQKAFEHKQLMAAIDMALV